MLACILHSLGAALPNNLLGPAYGNPVGHFEPRDFVALNDRILHSLDRTWLDPRPIDPAWFRSRPAYEFVQQIIVEIGRNYGNAPLILIKDPRICRLIPLYLTALDLIDVEPLVILPARPVREVVSSLAARDGLDPNLSELLWLRAVTEAELETRSCPRVWITLDQIIADWRRVAWRVAVRLGIDWSIEPDDAAAEVSSFLKPRLYHVSDWSFETQEHHSLAGRAWAAIEAGLAGHEDDVQLGLDAVRAALYEMDRLYAPQIANLRARYETELAAICQSKCWRFTAPFRAVMRASRAL